MPSRDGVRVGPLHTRRDENGSLLRIQGMSKPASRFDVLAQLGAMRRYARSLTRDASDAEDLVHDALVRAYAQRGSFRHGGNLRAWLLSILHNVFVDRVRARRAQAAREEEAGRLASEQAEAPHDHVVRLGEIRRAFFALPEEQRAALHLVAIEGLSYREAADTLGVPLGTLMSRIGRARAALRRLEEGVPGAEGPRLRLVGGRDDRAS